MIQKGLLNRMEFCAIGNTLDGCDMLPLHLDCKNRTRVDCLPINEDRT